MGKNVDRIRKKNGKIRLHAVTLESDIRYRGPLSYREFKIFGWACIILSQVIVMMTLGGKVNADLAVRQAGWKQVLLWSPQTDKRRQRDAPACMECQGTAPASG